MIYNISVFQVIKCPSDDCDASLNEDNPIYKKLPQNLRNKHEKIKSYKRISEDENKKFCSVTNCEGWFDITHPICSVCLKRYCPQCHYEQHTGSCSTQLIASLEKLGYRQCSRCKQMIEKVQGCNHIRCFCKYQFCYQCGSEWTSDHYRCRKGRRQTNPNYGQNCIAVNRDRLRSDRFSSDRHSSDRHSSDRHSSDRPNSDRPNSDRPNRNNQQEQRNVRTWNCTKILKIACTILFWVIFFCAYQVFFISIMVLTFLLLVCFYTFTGRIICCLFRARLKWWEILLIVLLFPLSLLIISTAQALEDIQISQNTNKVKRLMKFPCTCMEDMIA